MREQQTLGRRIQEGRKAAGLSQESLGERLGVSRQAVSKWEADTSVPELENLIAMSRIFGVTIGALLGVEPEAAEGRSEEDAPEAPGQAAEDTAPDGELTDRELAAVEAIVQKYLEAARRPRWSRRRKILAGAAVCGVLVLAVYALGTSFSILGDRLDLVQSQVNSIQGSVSSQIGNLSGQLSSLLEEQNSLVSDYGIQVTDYSLADQVWYLSVSATPKEYTAGTAATFTARTDTGATASAEAQNNGGVFTAENWAVPMGTSPGGEVQVSVVLTDGDAIRTQTLETLYEDPSAYRLDVDGFWDAEWLNGTLSFGSLDLQISNGTRLPVELTGVELALFFDGEAEPIWSGHLPTAVELWEAQGYVQMLVPAGPEDPVQLEKGQALIAAVHITDDHGQSFWHPLDGWISENGLLSVERSPDSLTGSTDPSGWKPGSAILSW